MRASSSDGRELFLRASAVDNVRVGDFVRIDADSAQLLGFVAEVTADGRQAVIATGSLVDGGGASPEPFVDAVVIPSCRSAASSRCRTWASASCPNRHTFWCGQSGSGKTYALGVALERIVLRTRLPVVVFDPNSDFVKRHTVRDEVDPATAEALAARPIRVLRPGGSPDALRIRFVTWMSAPRQPCYDSIPWSIGGSTTRWSGCLLRSRESTRRTSPLG